MDNGTVDDLFTQCHQVLIDLQMRLSQTDEQVKQLRILELYYQELDGMLLHILEEVNVGGVRDEEIIEEVIKAAEVDWAIEKTNKMLREGWNATYH